MAFTKFDEYLNAKGSIPKPKVTTKHTTDGSKKQYAAAPDAENNLTTDKEGGKVSGKKKKGMKYEAKGKMSGDWGKEGADLKWEPKTEFNKETDKFIKATESMDMSEFAQYVSEQHLITDDVKDIPTISTPHGAFIPAPHELFRTTRFMIATNNKFMESFIREVKRHDGMSALIAELATHPELFSELAKFLAEDEEFSTKLIRSIRLNEMVSGPMHKSLPDDLDAEEGDEEGPMDMDDEDEGDMEDEEGEEGEEGEDGPPMDMDDEDDMEGEEDEEGEEMHHHELPPALANLKKAMGMY